MAAIDPSLLGSIYRHIGDELRSLYRIGYTSSNAAPDGGWRSLSVRVWPNGATARSRAGYYAFRAERRYRAPR